MHFAITGKAAHSGGNFAAGISAISELGLVEMTRKRTRESLLRTLTEPCFYCEGKGYLKSKTTICCELLREIRRDGGGFKEDAIEVRCHPEIADMLDLPEGTVKGRLRLGLQKMRYHLPSREALP